MYYQTIKAIKQANEQAGFFFFSPDTMRFFNSKIYDPVYGEKFFITSEQFQSPRENGARKYTIRCISDDGDIEDVRGFQKYNSLREARKVALKLIGD